MAAVTRSGRVVAVLNTVDKTVSLIDASSNTVYATAAVGTVTNTVTYDTLAFSPDGSLLFVANITDNTVSRIVVQTGAVTTIVAGTGPCGCLVSPDGATCYVTNRTSNDVSAINTVTSAVSTIAVGETLGSTLAITPDNSKLFVGAFGSNNVYRIDLPGNVVTAIDFGNHEQGIVLSPDNQTLWCGTTQSMRSYTIATSTLNPAIATPGGATGVRMSANGRYLVGHLFATNTAWVLDVVSGVATNVAVGAGPNATSISPDSTIAYVACGTANVVTRIVLASNAVSNIAMPGASVRIALMHPLGNTCYCPQANSNNAVLLNTLAAAA